MWRVVKAGAVPECLHEALHTVRFAHRLGQRARCALEQRVCQCVCQQRREVEEPPTQCVGADLHQYPRDGNGRAEQHARHRNAQGHQLDGVLQEGPQRPVAETPHDPEVGGEHLVYMAGRQRRPGGVVARRAAAVRRGNLANVDRHGALEEPRRGERRLVGVESGKVGAREARLGQRLVQAGGDPRDVTHERAKAAKAERALRAAGIADLQDAVPLRRERPLGVARERAKEHAAELQLLERVQPLVERQLLKVAVQHLLKAGARRVGVSVRKHVGGTRSAVLRWERLPKHLHVVLNVGEGVEQVSRLVGFGGEARCAASNDHDDAVGPHPPPHLLHDCRVVAHAVKQQARAHVELLAARPCWHAGAIDPAQLRDRPHARRDVAEHRVVGSQPTARGAGADRAAGAAGAAADSAGLVCIRDGDGSAAGDL
mmetsp:Transcript_29671/g.87810  ORF Transcript_29671/g.87810 Transcript_29671/m.87810 type:complete len:429 (-) Transcript_29671:1335-2621(-)